MNLMLTEHVETSPDIHLYDTITHHGDPLMIYGVKITHMHDHVRIKIHDKYNPIRVRVNDNFFYGTKLQPSPRFFGSHPHRMRALTSTPVNLDREQQVNVYRDRVSLFGLSCDDCWGHLDKNIFPFDAVNLNKMTINSNMLKPDKLFVTDDDSLPWFVQHAEPKIYILTNEC